MKFLSNEEYKERINQKAALSNHTKEKRHCKFTNTTESDLKYYGIGFGGETSYHEEYFKKLLFSLYYGDELLAYENKMSGNVRQNRTSYNYRVH